MIFAANFKTNHNRKTTAAYIEELSAKLIESACEHDVFVFPPSTALDSFDTPIKVGAQNAYPTVNGAFTGEIGLEQLDEFGIDTILIGHSERREIIGESQEKIAEKFAFFKERNFEIIYCIGEPIEIREQGDEAVMEYLLEEFVGIDTNYEKLIIAYEPIWAIGTGRSATTEEISSTHSALKREVNKPLLYGGSAKPDNIEEILSIDGVDGVLVGSASLKVESFYSMINS
jgi:triosephosphate isomerase